ncbi:MAG TPA: VTT domain-containing protein [Candidatus Dormibacteraeota bacterium]
MAPQASGVAIVCALLFLEEAGLPLPVAPGEAVLIGAGLLVASGAVPIWLMAPLAYLAVICGALSGYTWAHRIGPKRLHALASRLHAGGPYDRAAARLRAASTLQIAASRLLPGLRVYTSLVAGAVGLNLRRFMTGVLPASALWVVAFMGLGLFVGAPVERLFGRFEAYGVRAVAVAVVVVVWVVAARWMPAAKPATAAGPHSGRWRLAVAFVLDLVAVTCVAGALSLITNLAGDDSGDLAFVAAIFAILGVLYLVVARQTVGYTLGEALLDVRYHPPRDRRRMQRLG